jgi:hypothetical protein
MFCFVSCLDLALHAALPIIPVDHHVIRHHVSIPPPALIGILVHHDSARLASHHDAESEDEPRDAIVTYLWDQVRELRAQLLEAQLQNAVIEAEVREEVVQETQETLEEMKRAYDERLAVEVGFLLVCKRLNDAEDVFSLPDST